MDHDLAAFVCGILMWMMHHVCLNRSRGPSTLSLHPRQWRLGNRVFVLLVSLFPNVGVRDVEGYTYSFRRLLRCVLLGHRIVISSSLIYQRTGCLPDDLSRPEERIELAPSRCGADSGDALRPNGAGAINVARVLTRARPGQVPETQSAQGPGPLSRAEG